MRSESEVAAAIANVGGGGLGGDGAWSADSIRALLAAASATGASLLVAAAAMAASDSVAGGGCQVGGRPPKQN